jgi:hypothetical protein
MRIASLTMGERSFVMMSISGSTVFHGCGFGHWCESFPRALGPSRIMNTLPDETVIDGEVVALDETGKPSF